MVRYKNRYITIQISSKSKKTKEILHLQSQALHEAIQKKVLEMYGDYGLAAIKAGFSAKYCNARTGVALIKIRHGPHMFVQNAIPKINDINGNYVNVKIIYIGATMKHCFIFIKKYQRQKLESMWSELKNENERKSLEEALMTLTPAVKDLM